MTTRQKMVVVALAIINVAVVAALVVLITGAAGQTPSPTPYHTASITPLPGFLGGTCPWEATQQLALAGLAGTATLTDRRALRFDIVHSLAPGQTIEEASQLVWTVLDIASTLEEGPCGPLAQVEVSILARGSQASTRIYVMTRMTDLLAYSSGALSENEFIDRVTYTTEELSQ